MPIHTTKRYGLGPFETRLGGFTSFSGSQAEEIRYGYYLPYTEGHDDVWGGPYIFGRVEIRDEKGDLIIF
jgi:hypothetical protein